MKRTNLFILSTLAIFSTLAFAVAAGSGKPATAVALSSPPSAAPAAGAPPASSQPTSGAPSAEGAHYLPGVRTTVLAKTDTTTAGLRIAYPQVEHAEATMIAVDLPPGTQTGWHSHTAPGYGFVVSGRLDLAAENGRTLHFEGGQAFAEMVGMRHNGSNPGPDTTRLLVVFTGDQGKPFTVK